MNENPDFVKERIGFFNKMNLSETTIASIKNLLFDSFGMPYNTFLQVPPAKIYRGQVSSGKPFEKKSRLSYNPNPTTQIGRANLIGETVFYASSSLDNAAIESCQDELRSGERVFHVTVGEWTLKSEINLNLMCHSKNAQSTGTDLPVAANALEPLMRKGRTEEQYKSLLLKSEFFSDQFAKTEVKCLNDYAFSAQYASEVLNKTRDLCDGICYPSVAYRLKGFNVAYKTTLFDNGTFIFTGAYFVKLTFVGLDIYPKFEILKETRSFSDDLINW
jgi:hypothetical protein